MNDLIDRVINQKCTDGDEDVKISICCPYPGMGEANSKWTKEQNERFKNAMERVEELRE